MRTSYKSERKQAFSLLCGNPEISPDDARFCIENSDRVVVCENAGNGAVGCGTFRLWGRERNKADIYLYVLPRERETGIGRRMLKSLTDLPECKALQFISTRIETNHAKSLEFFRKEGFESWYTELILCHGGERQPECNLELTTYRQEYFERYVAAIRRSFFELRSANDFEPYNCCKPDGAKRKELEDKKDCIYLLLDGERIAAAITVNPDSIEDVFVTPEYQGQGIGRKMMWFALNKAIDSGAGSIALSAITWNSRALNLYKSVGFRVAKEINYLRLPVLKDLSAKDAQLSL